jgi:hypothetical protein
MFHASWLCPTPVHRERFLEMHARLYTARLLTIAIGAVLLITVLPRSSRWRSLC